MINRRNLVGAGVLGLGGAEMDPAVVSDLKEGLSQLWAGLSLLYAAYGRVVAKDRLKLPFGLGAEE